VRNVERIEDEVRKSLRIVEMDGSISLPEISGAKDSSVGGGRMYVLRSEISLWRYKNHAQPSADGMGHCDSGFKSRSGHGRLSKFLVFFA
jgi:hypothetical protein